VLVDLYPENKEDIEKIISMIYLLSEHTKVLYEFDNPNFSNQLSDRKFVIRKLIPWTFKFLNALRKFNQFNMPMEVFLKGLTNNQSLIDILIQHFFRKTPTYFALGYFYVYLDYFYPKGGTSALAKVLEKKVLESGVDLKLNKYIATIDPSQSTVTDSEGTSYPYDHLIWAADLKTLYRSLHTDNLNAKISQQIETEAQRVFSAKGAESVFLLFLAVDRPPSWFQSRGGGHMFYTPSRKGLGETNRSARESLVKDFDRKSKDEILAWVNEYCNLNTYEVSIPALRDPALAPEGKTGMMISCLLDYDIVKKIEEAGWYEEFKKTMENRIIDLFSQTIFKNLADDVLFKFSSTPLTLNQISGSSEGAITGWSFETETPVANKLKDLPKSVLTPIPGVLKAGQWAYAPAGVPISMITGWYAYKEILKRSKK
jgi:phytoene dehydrogenase-like protein